jgi:hypothetical protein
MPIVNIQSKQSIFFGVHFLLVGEWGTDSKRLLDFQKALLDEGLEFSETGTGPRSFVLTRKESSAFQVKIGSVGPQVSEIKIVTPERPSHVLDPFCKEAEAVCRAYIKVWAGMPCQVLRCDATIRHLYSCNCHAFKHLWEDRLGQQEDDLKYLGGRPVLGGGLRLVLPRVNQWKDHVEVKIESFLGDPEKIFIETMFLWPDPFIVNTADGFNSTGRLKELEKYATHEVCDFLLKDKTEDNNGNN